MRTIFGDKSLHRILRWLPVAAGSLTAVALIVVSVPDLRARATRWVTGREAPLRVGDKLAVSSAIYERSQFTAVLFARSTCGVCAKAAPHLTDLRSELSKDLKVTSVYMSTEDALSSAEVSFGATMGFDRSSILLAPAPVRLRLRGVPALVLVDSTGRVRFMDFAGVRSAGQAIELASRTLKTLGLR